MHLLPLGRLLLACPVFLAPFARGAPATPLPNVVFIFITCSAGHLGVFLTAGAIGEFIADKLPRTGKRTAAGPLVARMISGALCGAGLCVASDQSWSFGAALGVVGAIIGSFAGYTARTGLVRKLAVADMSIAIPEDLLAIGLAVVAVSCL